VGVDLAVYVHFVAMNASGPESDPRAAVVEVTGADIQRLRTYPVSDETFAQVLEILTAAGARGVAPPEVLAGTDQVGFNNTVEDPDAIVRRGLLFMEDGEGGVGYSLSLLLALRYLADESVHPTSDPENPTRCASGRSRSCGSPRPTGGTKPRTSAASSTSGTSGTPRYFTAVTIGELLDGTADRSLFRHRIVVIGTAAESTPS
jgi:CHASE2 domain-containing sensor protein